MDALTLGDAQTGNTDETYTGVVSSDAGVFSADFYRQKITEFQGALNALDEAYQAGVMASQVVTTQELTALLFEYENRVSGMRATAEAINAGAAAVNALGGRMPVMSLPQTLGLAPLAAAIAAAIPAAILGAAATYVYFAASYVPAMQNLLRAAKEALPYVDTSTPEGLAAHTQLDAAIGRADSAQRSLSMFGGLTAIAGWVKWGAIAFLGYLAWKQFGGKLRGND